MAGIKDSIDLLSVSHSQIKKTFFYILEKKTSVNPHKTQSSP